MTETVVKFAPDHVRQLKRALDLTGGTHTVEDIERGLSEGQYQSWEGKDSIVVTEIIETPQKRVLLFFLAGGNMLEIRRLYHIILAWGKHEMGCDMARIVGRRGWERSFLADEGWRPTAVVLERGL